MNTEEFFSTVLPSSGQMCIAVKTDKGMKHFFGRGAAWGAQVVETLLPRNYDVYHACASFKSDEGRTQANAATARSFWLDVDAGPGKPYETSKDAGRAVLSFASKVGLPRPMVVRSGRGVHAYWPMPEDMPTSEWRETATLLKQVARLAGLDADPSRTSDSASLLRPVGSKNFKDPSKPRDVILVCRNEPVALETFKATLLAYVEVCGEQPEQAVAPAGKVANLNADLMGVVEYPPSSADAIAEKCAAVAKVRDTRGNVSQPEWYHTLQILAHTTEGDEHAHLWSSGHPNYRYAETQAVLDRVKAFKPTTCAKMGEHFAECAGCPLRGTIKSPISLGYVQGIVDETLSVAESAADDPQKKGRPKFPEGWGWVVPTGGKHEALCKAEFIEVEDGEGGVSESLKWTAVSGTCFYPVSRIEEPAGGQNSYSLDMAMELRGGGRRLFSLKVKAIGEGGRSLMGELGDQEILAMPGKDVAVKAYLGDWLTHLLRETDPKKTYTRFGWFEKNFVIGRTMITPTGDVPVLLAQDAAIKGDAFEPKGTLEAWKEIIDKAYNAPGQEPFQYLVMSSFASPLMSMFRSIGGTVVYAHSEGSGAGKTTAQRAGISAWGDWGELQLADGKATDNALWALVGMYHHLPVLYDELTNMSNARAAEIVFAASNGRQKQRAAQTGHLRQSPNDNFANIIMASGNNLMSEKISSHRAHAEAELSRLFEFTVRVKPHLTPNEAIDLFPLLMDNYGHAGRVFIRHVVENYDEVQDMLMTTLKRFNDEAGISQKERFWSALQAAVITASIICRRLDLVRFNLTNLKDWLVCQTIANRDNRSTSVPDAGEMLAKALADLWEGVIVTRGEGALHGAGGTPATVLHAPRGTVVGRAILPVDHKDPTHVLYIGTNVIREWCSRHGVSAREMVHAGVAAGWVDPEPVKYSLGKGVEAYSSLAGRIICYKIYPERMGLAVPASILQSSGGSGGTSDVDQ